MSELHISPLTDHVYIVNGKKKTDVTDQFLFCVIKRWNGFEQTIRDASGKAFRIRVEPATQQGHPADKQGE